MNKKELFKTAWTLARKAAADLGTAVRSQFAPALKAAWAAAKAPVVAVKPAFQAPAVHSCIRGGGCGARAWIARIVGLHPTYVFEREFVDCDSNTSRSGRSGSLHWRLPKPGYYEYRGLQYDSDSARIGQLDNCFVEVGEDGVIYEATKAEVLGAMKASVAVA